MTVDLRTCNPGDRLLSSQGIILTYVGPSGDSNYPHKVKYPNLPQFGPDSYGTRLDNGQVFASEHDWNQSWSSWSEHDDHDIIEILKEN
jgi:hypothetical protein